MYSAVRSADKCTPYVVNLVADTDGDVSSLPTHYAAGSTCFAIDSSTTYVLNHDKEWVATTSSSGDGSGSSSGDTVDIGLATQEQIDNLFGGSSSSSDEVEASLATEEQIDDLFE